MAHETFGQYLLLKKLSEDTLGEVFRAGRLRDGNLEQVVLLRVFNASVIEAEAVIRGIQERLQVQSALRSPNIAQGLEAGDYQGIPFVVYDYISGRDLGSLMQQASLRSHPVPTEHALLIAERLALGLSVAHGTKLGSDRILHGFLVPEFVMLSNEGENRILGFEVSTALRSSSQSSQLWSQFGRYLSPEAHGGEALKPTDDVYSLGVVLLELLVGHTLENLGPSSLEGAIAQVSGRGLPNVANLIEQSVAPADQRIANAAAWHEQLNRLVLDRQSSSTPFHLAFYMHNLFRDEIEQESEEIEHERSLDFSKETISTTSLGSDAPLESEAPTSSGTLPPIGSSPDLAPPPPSTTPTPTPAGSDTFSAESLTTEPPPPQAPEAKEEDSSGGSKGLLIAAVLLVLIAAGGFYAWQQFGTGFLGGASGNEGTTAELNDTSAAPVSAERPTEPGAAGPTTVVDARSVAEIADSDTVDPDAAGREAERERMMAELDRLVAERTKTAAEGIKSEYDQEVAQLREELEKAEREKAERERKQREAEAARLAAAQAEQERLEAERKAEEERKRREAEAAAEAEQATSEQATPQQQGAQEQEQAQEKPEPAVRRGELVQPGPGVQRPRLSSEIRPAYPFAAQRLRQEADVDVEVLVDENGEVADTRLNRKVGFGFDKAARDAAAKASFSPATKHGVPVKMWTTIKVRFRLDGI